MAAKARARLDGADAINVGLRAFLPLTDGGGTSPVDISSYRRTSGLTSRTLGIPKLIGRAAKFDDFNQVINVGGPKSLATTSTLGLAGRTSLMAVSAWVYLPSATGAGGFFKLGSGSDGFALGIGNTTMDSIGSNIVGLYEFVRWVPTGVSFSVGWHHVVMSLNASGYPSIYYDGKLIYSDTTGAPNAVGASGACFIGGASSSSRLFTGHVSNFRVWGRSITPLEVARLYREPWAGTTRRLLRAVYTPGTQYTLDTEALAYEHTVGDAALLRGRTLDAEALAYEHAVGDAGFIVRRTLDAEPVAYTYRVPTVGLSYNPVQPEGDTHDGFKRRSRRERALDAAERRRREAAAEEALALRLALEAAMGEAAEAVEEAPAPAVEAVEVATRQAARYVPLLVRGPAPEVLQAANEAIVALRSAVAAADRARMLAEDDEDVMMLLRAL